MRGSIPVSAVRCGVLLMTVASCVHETQAQEKAVTPAIQTEAAKVEAAKGKMVTVSGTVVGPDGAPVAAKIAIRQFTRANRLGEEETNVVATDDKGVFTTQVEVPTGLPTQVEQILGQAVVAAPGLVPTTFLLSDATDPKQPLVVKLRKGVTVSGVIKDAGGAPLPGLKIQLNGMVGDGADPTSIQGYVFIPKGLQPDVTVVTGADGRWTMDNILPKGRAWMVLSDPKWAQHRIDVKVGEGATEAPEIVARPGAILRGKVMREDGTPAAKAQVAASNQTGNYGKAQAGDDGSFQIESLASGAYSVGVADPERNWVMEPLTNVVLKEGAVQDAPALTLIKGALIEGTVSDAATGAPLAGVQIGSARGNSSQMSEPSDAKGRYSLRVTPGKTQLYVMAKPPAYLNPENGSPSRLMPLEIEKGATKTLDWKLPRGVGLAGTIKVEAGAKAPLPDKLSITFREVGAERHWDAPSAVIKDNAWKLEGLNAKPYKLVTSDEEWEVVTPATLNAPQTNPVEIVLRHVTVPSLVGKVVTREGKPVEKVKVNANILIPAGENSYTGRDTVVESGADGSFQIPKVKADYRVTLSASREGYKYLRGGEAEAKDGAWTMKEVVMLPLQSHVAGRVVDAKGQPVVGARILSPDGNPPSDDPKTRIVSDAQGRFELAGLPDGDVTVIAASLEGAATMRAKSTLEAQATAKLEWKLRPYRVVTEPDVDRAHAILEDVWETSRGSNWYRRNSVPADLVAADFDAALDLARGADAKKPIPEDVLAQLITKLIETDPARAVEWAPAQLAAIKGDYLRLNATVEVGLAAVKINPEVAAQMLAAAKVIPIGDGQLKMYGPAQIAALEARLGHEEAANTLADGVLAAVKASKADAPGMLGAVAEVFAKGSASLALHALKQIVVDPKKEYEQTSAYTRAIDELVKHDLAGAQQLLETLGKLENQQAEYAFGQAARSVIKRLAPTDFKAALALARRINENYRAEGLLLVAGLAPKTEALPLLREAAAAVPQHHWNGGIVLGSIARLAADLDATAGKEILDQVKANIDTMKRADGPGNNWRAQQGGTSIAAYAVALSRTNPLESRLMLEEEWAFTRGQGSAQRGHNTQTVLAVAMASIDSERALELSWQIEGQNQNANAKDAKTDLSPQFEAQRNIARFLLAPSAPLNEVFDRF